MLPSRLVTEHSPFTGSIATVTAVLPTRNNLDELIRCVESLQAQSCPPVRIVVCVDGSTDGTIEHFAERDDDGPAIVDITTHPENAHRGRAATRNLALPLIDTDYVWFVDSDMVLEPDALAEHFALVESRPCVSQGHVHYANADEAQWAAYLDVRAYHRSPDRAVIPFTWYSAANSMVRADYVRELGGFDPRFVGYGGEDFDFAYRLERLSGEPLVNNARARASTVEDKTIEQALRQFEEYGATNLHLLESLHPEMTRTFELQRIGSPALADRLFVAAVNPFVEGVVDLLVRVGPRRVRNLLMNYKVISAVWRGYRSGSAVSGRRT